MWGCRPTDCLQSVSPTRAAKTGLRLKAWLLKYAANLSHTFQRVVQSEVNGPECAQAAEKKKKKNNLGDVPVSHHTAEAKVMFTWVTHDKTREARSQEQTGANSIFAIRACIMPIKVLVGVEM